jgi:hypothetical protein
MYARNISFRLKSNMQSDYTRTFENQILPLLRKQKGFKDEITLSNSGSQDATLANLIDGTPRVQTFETVMSTFHNVAVAV